MNESDTAWRRGPAYKRLAGCNQGSGVASERRRLRLGGETSSAIGVDLDIGSVSRGGHALYEGEGGPTIATLGVCDFEGVLERN